MKNLSWIPIILSSSSIILSLILLYFILFSTIFDDRLEGNKKPIIAIVLIAYTLFRGYRVYLTIKKRNNDQQ